MILALSLSVAGTIVAIVLPDAPSRFAFWREIMLAALWVAIFFGFVFKGERVEAVVSACLAGACAYLAWRNRPRGKRLADKVTGVVRNLGHKLAVVPGPGGAR